MKVKEIMICAFELCGRKDLADFLNGKGNAPVAEAQREAESMLRCYNLAENEIALDYLPIRRTETFYSDGAVLLSAFSQTPLEILSVKSEKGEALSFTQAEESIRVRAGKAVIEYSVRPRVKAQSDEAEIAGKGGGRVLALGAASEYALMSGMLDTAALLDRRFRDALTCACRERGGRIRMRRWV